MATCDQVPCIVGADKKIKKTFFLYFFEYLAASAAKYCGKGLAAIGESFGEGLERIWGGFGKFEILEMLFLKA